ncbi:MAG: hypothetical protein ACFCVE_10740 [Phycisphaerae bacterium]
MRDRRWAWLPTAFKETYTDSNGRLWVRLLMRSPRAASEVAIHESARLAMGASLPFIAEAQVVMVDNDGHLWLRGDDTPDVLRLFDGERWYYYGPDGAKRDWKPEDLSAFTPPADYPISKASRGWGLAGFHDAEGNRHFVSQAADGRIIWTLRPDGTWGQRVVEGRNAFDINLARFAQVNDRLVMLTSPNKGTVHRFEGGAWSPAVQMRCSVERHDVFDVMPVGGGLVVTRCRQDHLIYHDMARTEVPPDRELLEALVHPEWQVREKMTRRLAALPPSHVGRLLELAERTNSPEARGRLRAVVRQIQSPADQAEPGPQLIDGRWQVKELRRAASRHGLMTMVGVGVRDLRLARDVPAVLIDLRPGKPVAVTPISQSVFEAVGRHGLRESYLDGKGRRWFPRGVYLPPDGEDMVHAAPAGSTLGVPGGEDGQGRIFFTADARWHVAVFDDRHEPAASDFHETIRPKQQAPATLNHHGLLLPGPAAGAWERVALPVPPPGDGSHFNPRDFHLLVGLPGLALLRHDDSITRGGLRDPITWRVYLDGRWSENPDVLALIEAHAAVIAPRLGGRRNGPLTPDGRGGFWLAGVIEDRNAEQPHGFWRRWVLAHYDGRRMVYPFGKPPTTPEAVRNPRPYDFVNDTFFNVAGTMEGGRTVVGSFSVTPKHIIRGWALRRMPFGGYMLLPAEDYLKSWYRVEPPGERLWLERRGPFSGFAPERIVHDGLGNSFISSQNLTFRLRDGVLTRQPVHLYLGLQDQAGRRWGTDGALNLVAVDDGTGQAALRFNDHVGSARLAMSPSGTVYAATETAVFALRFAPSYDGKNTLVIDRQMSLGDPRLGDFGFEAVDDETFILTGTRRVELKLKRKPEPPATQPTETDKTP